MACFAIIPICIQNNDPINDPENEVEISTERLLNTIMFRSKKILKVEHSNWKEKTTGLSHDAIGMKPILEQDRHLEKQIKNGLILYFGKLEMCHSILQIY